ncbi:MAG TPA: arginase family protein [Candidatus Nitrosotalea sp.]|nr:arginase family protein [Candidatus Nitrosotalea sp.]
MAVKIHRDPKKVALIGVPSSAGSHGPGAERAPAALRAAGLQARLEAAGFEVVDHGDTPVFPYQPDEEHPRARNTAAVVQAMSALRLKAEIAVKSGALLLILGGDCAITPGTIAGIRRYYKEVGVFWMDRDADLNTPTTTPSGCVHGMTVAHLIGRGAAEIVRFSADMPMVREPNLALYGIERLDPPEEQTLLTTPLRAYYAADIVRRGPAATAREAVERIHSKMAPFILHYDVDVVSAPDFTACGFPAEGSLNAAHIREALAEVVAAPQLLAIELCEYFPDLDGEGNAARFLVELFAEALAGRLRALTAPPEEKAVPAEALAAAEPPAETQAADAAPAEAAPAEPAAADSVSGEPQAAEAVSAPAADAAATSAGE